MCEFEHESTSLNRIMDSVRLLPSQLQVRQPGNYHLQPGSCLKNFLGRDVALKIVLDFTREVQESLEHFENLRPYIGLNASLSNLSSIMKTNPRQVKSGDRDITI